MVKITLDLEKTVEQNASVYFDKAKKFKKKIEGAKEALAVSKKKLEKLKKKKPEEKEIILKKRTKKEWYEKFRWFNTSEGFLVVGGRDATTNEIVIKKHTEKEDVVFHTDMSGSPFFVIKAEKGKTIGKQSLEETAQATAAFSRAWKLGLGTIDVFHVKPEQVSKEANSGEYMSKGSFMIRGKTIYHHPKIEAAIGIKDGILISGPVDAIKKNADKFFVVIQGNTKASDAAKAIGKEFGIKEMDDIIRMLPTGGIKIKK